MCLFKSLKKISVWTTCHTDQKSYSKFVPYWSNFIKPWILQPTILNLFTTSIVCCVWKSIQSGWKVTQNSPHLHFDSKETMINYVLRSIIEDVLLRTYIMYPLWISSWSYSIIIGWWKLCMNLLSMTYNLYRKNSTKSILMHYITKWIRQILIELPGMDCDRRCV